MIDDGARFYRTNATQVRPNVLRLVRGVQFFRTLKFAAFVWIGLLSRCHTASRSLPGWPDRALDGEYLVDALNRLDRQGALRRSACSKKWRRPWLQHAASAIGPGLRLPS